MKVFISWSGEISGKVARILRDWLPYVIPSIEPYVSTEDITKGARWNNEISKELDTASFGILCVTKDNVNSPWLNFEAGALSKSLEMKSSNQVCPFLFGIAPKDIISGPLQQFQATSYNKEDLWRLVKSLNSANEKKVRENERLKEVFNVWWPKLYVELEPVYRLVNKKVVWAFETSNLNAEDEMKMMANEGVGVSQKWYLRDDTPPQAEECDLLVYVYGKSNLSTERLTEVVEFVKRLSPGTPLIVYTRYASGDKRLNDEEFLLTQTHTKTVISNMPETLRQQIKNLI